MKFYPENKTIGLRFRYEAKNFIVAANRSLVMKRMN